MSRLMLKGPIHLQKASAQCWKCREQTHVLALVATAVHEQACAPPPPQDMDRSFVYNISEQDMPASLADALTACTQNYRPTWSNTLNEKTWANRCSNCGSLQGAFFLHSEPDGPFFGGPDANPEGQASEQLLSADDVLVRAASYSL